MPENRKFDIKTEAGKAFSQYWSLIVLFLLAFALFRAVPPCADLWWGRTVYRNTGGIWQWLFSYQAKYYGSINGRISGTFISCIMEADPSGILWDIFAALLIVLIVYLIHKIFRPRRILPLVMAASALLFMISPNMRGETLFYAVSTYVIPVPLVLAFLFAIGRYMENGKNTRNGARAALIALPVIICTLVENVTLAFVACFGIFLLWHTIRKKTFDRVLWISFFVSVLSAAIVFLSPGIHVQRTVVSQTAGFAHTIITNFKTGIEMLVGENLAMFAVLFAILLLFVISQKGMKRGKKAALLALLGLCEGGFLLCALLGIVIGSTISVVVLVMVAALLLFALIWTISLCAHRSLLLFLLGMAVFSMGAMLPIATENLYYRVIAISYFFLAALGAGIFCEIHLERKAIRMIAAVLSAGMFLTVFDQMWLVGTSIHAVDVEQREILGDIAHRQRMNEWDYEQAVFIPKYRPGDYDYFMVLPDAENYPFFLEYYGLDQKTVVLQKGDPFQHYATLRLEGNAATAAVHSVEDGVQKPVSIRYILMQDGTAISEVETAELQYTWEALPAGTYAIEILADYGGGVYHSLPRQQSLTGFTVQ